MDWQPVDSKLCAEIAHDPLRNETHVRFHSGKVHAYPMTREEHDEFAAADSLGAHYNTNMKGKGRRVS